MIRPSAQSAIRAPTNRATVTVTVSAPKIIFAETTTAEITIVRPPRILTAVFQVDFSQKKGQEKESYILISFTCVSRGKASRRFRAP